MLVEAFIPGTLFAVRASQWHAYFANKQALILLQNDKTTLRGAGGCRTVPASGGVLTQIQLARLCQPEGATFAVGAAEAPDAARARAALEAMQIALVRNIGATVTSQKTAADADRATRDVDASGTVHGVPMRLVGHFEARGKRFYQVIVLGKAQALPPEQVEQFLTSFKLP
jgi:hypothetical protein